MTSTMGQTVTAISTTPSTPTRRPSPWEPARPLGTHWTRMSDSVRFLASMATFATGNRVTTRR